MKVYLVYEHNYSNPDVVGIYSTVDNALNAVNTINIEGSIYEVELDSELQTQIKLKACEWEVFTYDTQKSYKEGLLNLGRVKSLQEFEQKVIDHCASYLTLQMGKEPNYVGNWSITIWNAGIRIYQYNANVIRYEKT